MKQIITCPKLPTINIDKLPEFPIIGFTTNGRSTSPKGRCQLKTHKDTKYLFISSLDGSCSSVRSCNSVRGCIEFINRCGFTPYLFDTEKELFAWLAQ